MANEFDDLLSAKPVAQAAPENESFDDLLSAKPSAQQEKPAEQPFWQKALAKVGDLLGRVPAAIRGGVQAYQQNDAPNAASMAFSGLKDPASVQSSPEMMAGFGADTTMKPSIKTPAPDAAITAKNMSLVPGSPEWAKAVNPDTVYSSQAQDLGTAFDNLAPTGLEFLPPALGSMMKSIGGTAERMGVGAIPSALKPSKALREAPIPFKAENFFSDRAGAPEGGLASAMGKGKTLQNIQDFHEKIGNQQDQLLDKVPQVDLVQAISDASKDVEDAIAHGGNSKLGISVKDAPQLRNEISQWLPAAEEISPSGVTNGQNARNFRGSLANEARYDHPDNTAPARVVAATIRDRLNEQLGQLSPEFRDLDKQFSQTIPLRNAVADALGREGNKYPIGLRTSMVIASHGASIPAEIAKMALLEGSSRFGPQVALAKAGRSIGNTAAPIANLPPWLSVAGRDAAQTQSLPPSLQGAR